MEGLLHYDAIIVGAGPAGIAAALEASRSGAKTALLERYGSLGGNLTNGLVGPMLGELCGGTIAAEIEAVLGTVPGVCHDFEAAKGALAQLLYNAGVDVYLQTLPAFADMHNGYLSRLHCAGKFGSLCFSAPAFIDATGDGDLAALCGAQWEMGREEDGLVQPVSLMFTVTGIAPGQGLVCWHEKHVTDLGDGREYLSLCRKAHAEGRLPENVNIVRLYATADPTERVVNAAQANRVDPLNAASMFRAEVEQRQEIETILHFLRSEIPGFEHVRVKSTPSTMGVRESRRILGDYTLTAEDLLLGRTFPDAVVHRADYCLDIHNPAGAGQAEGEDACPTKTKPYDIPFSVMRPKGLENVLTAGRCISGTHTAHASYRVMRICMATGQAAGAAAHLMAKNVVTSRKLDPQLIRQHLMSRGVNLSE